jgi:hypothetical protein
LPFSSIEKLYIKQSGIVNPDPETDRAHCGESQMCETVNDAMPVSYQKQGKMAIKCNKMGNVQMSGMQGLLFNKNRPLLKANPVARACFISLALFDPAVHHDLAFADQVFSLTAAGNDIFFLEQLVQLNIGPFYADSGWHGIICPTWCH